MTDFIDDEEVVKAISALKPDEQLFEIRVIGDKKTYSGYFRKAETLLSALHSLRDLDTCNAYITLNKLDEACYDRLQKDKFVQSPKTTTSDNDVTDYEWLMIDLDPKRPAGTSSTDEQVFKAERKASVIFSYLKSLGFGNPLFGRSGNGMHLLYKVNAANTEENRKIFEMSLKALDFHFSDEEIDVDRKNFNPSRICKLYGTRAQKGTETADRRHRMSRIADASKQENLPSVTDISCLKKLCATYPQEEMPQRYNGGYSGREFDLEGWLSKYGIGYQKSSYHEATKYILDCCPFNSNHKKKDACLLRQPSGAIGFKCFHNSCSGKTWRDVRLLFEPDAYDKQNQEYGQNSYGRDRPIRKQTQPPPAIQPVNDEPIFYTAADILNMPVLQEEFVKSGIELIDRKMRGLKKGYVSVISGLRAAGKSSIISGICLDCVESGRNVGVFSGELSPRNFMRWMNLQAAGQDHVEPTEYENYYNVARDNQKAISTWLGEHFWLYNNKYGNNYQAMIDQFQQCVIDKKLDILILDNLMALNIANMGESKYDAQSAFVLDLKRIAEKTNIHVMFVAHPRKAMGFLRLDDISGSGDLSNAVDNAFIIHRVNQDFKRLSQQMFGWKDSNDLYSATNVIEIAKDRDGGIQDFFVPLYYQKESKRLRNSKTENKVYGWCKRNVDVKKQDDINEEVPFD